MKKFIIVTTQRTGSTLLWKCLDQHPNISAYGELFISEDTNDGIRYNNLNNINTPINKYLNKFYKMWSTEIVGFKLMHGQMMEYKGIVKWIENNNPYIIHLERINKAKQYVSIKLTKVRGKSHLHIDEKIVNPKIKINRKGLISYIQRKEKEHIEMENMFNEYRYYKMYYEIFTSSIQVEINKVFKFLGVEPYKIEVPLKKISPNDLSKVITNYNEIRGFLE